MLFFGVRPIADPNIFSDTLVKVPARVADIVCIAQIFAGSPQDFSDDDGLF